MTMAVLSKPTPVWHAILSYFYMACFYLWVAVWNVMVFFNATVLAQADAELLDELRRLEEQEKAILEDETATVTTEEDHDDRRQTIDSLDDAYDNSMRNYVMLSELQYRCS
jgi:hypothetical protein